MDKHQNEARQLKLNQLKAIANGKHADIARIEGQIAPLPEKIARLKPDHERYVSLLNRRLEAIASLEAASNARVAKRQQDEQQQCERAAAEADTLRQFSFMDYKVYCLQTRIDAEMRKKSGI